MQELLIPTDFSPNSNKAIAFGVQVAQKLDAKVSLLHVYSPTKMQQESLYSLADGAGNAVQRMESVVNKDVREKALERMKDLAANHGILEMHHRLFLREGAASHEIRHLMTEHPFDLVVMGTLGDVDKGSIFIGSTTMNIVRHSKAPVLAVPEGAKYRKISKIVYATDLHHDDHKSMLKLIGFAQLFDAEVVMVHVTDEGGEAVVYEQLLKKMVDKYDYPKLSYELVHSKYALLGIDAYVINHDIDMVAVTTHTKNIWERLTHQSVTKELMTFLQRPLLVFN